MAGQGHAVAGVAEWQAECNQRQSDAAIQFCLSNKTTFGLALRQCLALVQMLLGLAELDLRVPVSTVCGRQKGLRTALAWRPNGGELLRLLGSKGIKFQGEVDWKRKKHATEYIRQWRKVRLGIDAQTLEILAVEVTDTSVDVAPVLS